MTLGEEWGWGAAKADSRNAYDVLRNFWHSRIDLRLDSDDRRVRRLGRQTCKTRWSEIPFPGSSSMRRVEACCRVARGAPIGLIDCCGKNQTCSADRPESFISQPCQSVRTAIIVGRCSGNSLRRRRVTWNSGSPATTEALNQYAAPSRGLICRRGVPEKR